MSKSYWTHYTKKNILILRAVNGGHCKKISQPVHYSLLLYLVLYKINVHFHQGQSAPAVSAIAISIILQRTLLFSTISKYKWFLLCMKLNHI